MVCSFSMLKQTKFKYLATFYKPKKKKNKQTKKIEQTAICCLVKKQTKIEIKVTTKTQQKTQKTNNIDTESTTY